MRQPLAVLIRGNFVPVLTWISFYEGKDFCQFSPNRGHATHNLFPRPATSVTWRLNDKSVSSSAEPDQRLCLWKPQPFEKGWRKLYFSETRCREAASRVSHQTNTRIGCRLSLLSVYSLRRRSPLGYGWCRPPRRSPPASGFWLGCRTASSSPTPYRCCLKRCADP